MLLNPIGKENNQHHGHERCRQELKAALTHGALPYRVKDVTG